MTANLTPHSLIVHILTTCGAWGIRTAYKNYLSSAVAWHSSVQFLTEKIRCFYCRRAITRTWPPWQFSRWDFLAGRVEEQINSDDRAINTSAALWPLRSFFLSLSSRYCPSSSDGPVRFLCRARTIYATGRTMATEFASLGYWITSDKWSDSVRGN